MRVALLSLNVRSRDAIGNQVAEKLAFFLDRGADVRVLVESEQSLHPAVQPYCRTISNSETKGENWRFLASADLVVVEYGQYYPLLDLLPLLGGGKGRVLFDYHGVTPADMWSLHQREALEAGSRQRGLVWSADAALAHSHFTRQELQGGTGFPPERISCLGHPLDRQQFCPGPAQCPLADVLGVHEGTFLLFVGRLAPNKSVPVLIEAVARLRDVTPPVHAVVIGDAGDVYQAEARRSRETAAELGVADRVHLLGQVSAERLRDAYRSAAVLVIPSRHEGFCIPVIEAMACGLPVVAARNAALPETVAGAGLAFTPDDAEDLARQIRRSLGPGVPSESGPRLERLDPGWKEEGAQDKGAVRVAVVAFRYGSDFVGGAETSLRRIAESLRAAGQHVEVFTTCTREESAWSNQLPEGTTSLGDLPVHRYRLDAHDRHRHRESVRAIVESEGKVSAKIEEEYLRHSIHSTRLLAALSERSAEFDVVITGPYLYGLTVDVARAFPDKTLVMPCFHDEPLAWLAAWRLYEQTAGILYHSAEEQSIAQTQLGLNHPGASCIGGLVDTDATLQPRTPETLPLLPGRYIVYCGRYSAQKAVPVLLDYAQRYTDLYPDRFSFVFAGQGEVPIPQRQGFHDLGFVEEAVKREVMAGASALVQLSRQESLSYAALEAWSRGTPVIGDRNCAVLAAHLQRCGGGQSVGSFEEFAQALDDLWQRPEEWRERGRAGREYVKDNYGSRKEFSHKLMEAIDAMKVPLRERMTTKGLERAAEFDRHLWRERFGELVESVLHAGPRPYRAEIEVKPRTNSRTVAAGSLSVFIPIRVVNRGSHAVVSCGPGRTVLRYRIRDENGATREDPAIETQLPGLVMPGRAVAAAVEVAVPAKPGAYQVAFWVEQRSPVDAAPVPKSSADVNRADLGQADFRLTLTVAENASGNTMGSCSALLHEVQNAVAEAHRRQHLPADYADVTQGWLATWKRRIKRKLLGNFKHAYVDVLSRQQSAFNHFVLTALEELAECCATLDHVRQAPGAALAAQLHDLSQQLAESQQRCAQLEERLNRMDTGRTC